MPNFDNILPSGSYHLPGSNGDFGPRNGRSISSGASNNHKGYDLGAPSGTPVHNPYDGIVVGLGVDGTGRYAGNWIAIQHTLQDGTVVITRYLHLQSPPSDNFKTNQRGQLRISL